jgi:6,7-dimethyl-8-ribityllumazine synthase
MRREEIEKKTAPKDASKLRVGVVVASFNHDITDALLEGALKTLATWRVKKENITVLHVPGSYEIPYGCLKVIKAKKKPHCVVALGCILKGETKHDEYISNAVAQGITRLMLEHNVPIGFGVLTPNTLEQAKARSSGDANHGAGAAAAALEMALTQ